MFKKEDFFNYIPDPIKKNHLYQLKGITFTKGDLTTIYHASGIGGSFFCYQLISELDSCLLVNTDNDYLNVPLLKNKLIVKNNIIEDIVKILNIVCSNGIEFVFIDKVSSIVCKKELTTNLYSKNNTFPSVVTSYLIKTIKYLSSRYGTTFFLVSPTRLLKNKTDSLLREHSNNIYQITKDKNIYYFGECIGYKLLINKTIQQKVIFTI